ncbi:hypothetical protein WCLP8_5090009 [uncultured Gammaproteobacteria bacterium]
MTDNVLASISALATMATPALKERWRELRLRQEYFFTSASAARNWTFC